MFGLSRLPIFSKKVFKRYRSDEWRKNLDMQHLMERPEFKKALQTNKEKAAFFDHFQKYAKDGKGLMQKELRPMFKEMERDHNDDLTDKDVRALKRGIMDRITGRFKPLKPQAPPPSHPRQFPDLH